MAILTLLLKKQERGSMAKPTAPPGREGFPPQCTTAGRDALLVGCREKGREDTFFSILATFSVEFSSSCLGRMEISDFLYLF